MRETTNKTNAGPTPGPWVNSHGTIIGPKGKVAEAGNPGCDGFGADTEDESIANARLIAAAPDLLAALRAVVGSTVDGMGAGCAQVLVSRKAVDAARAALSRATGGAR